MTIKYINILFILLFLLIHSCSCEKENPEEYNPSSPGWVATQFFFALQDNAYYEAEQYCDKSSKKKLENDYLYLDDLPTINFIKVDSCDEYEDHTYCYCRYLKEDSSEQTNKLLLRNLDNIWKVHYEGLQIDSNDSRFYSRVPVLNELAPSYLSELLELEKTDLDSVVSSSIRIMNHLDFVVGFMTEDNLSTIVPNAKKKYNYNDFYVQRLVLEMINVSQTFTFEGNAVLNFFEVVIMDIDSENKFGEFQYLAEQLSQEYGIPYNAQKLISKEMFKYKEMKWFLKGYNEELILSCEFQNLTLTLAKAK